MTKLTVLCWQEIPSLVEAKGSELPLPTRILRDSSAFLGSYWYLLAAGAVLVNINPAYRTHELEYALRASRAKALLLIESLLITHCSSRRPSGLVC